MTREWKAEKAGVLGTSARVLLASFLTLLLAPAWGRLSGSALAEEPTQALVIEQLTPAEQAAATRTAKAAQDAPAGAPDARLLAFDEALSEIVARSTAVSIQQSTLSATIDRNRPTRLSFLPTLGIEGKQSSTRVSGADSSYNARQLEVVSGLNLFRGGADVAGIFAARADEASQRALLDDFLLGVENEAVSSLISEITRRKEIAILAEIVKKQGDLLLIAQQRYAGGYLALQEVGQFSVDLANTRAQLADAQVAGVQTAAALENLLGHARILPEWPWQEKLASLPANDPASALGVPKAATTTGLAELLSHRPDWRAAQARAEAEDERVSRGYRLLAPSLDASLSYGFYGSLNNDSGASKWTGQLTLSLPLFDRLVIYSAARAQAHVRGAAEAQLEQVRRSARADWDAARGSFETVLVSARARDQTLAISRKLYDDNLKRLRSGRISANDLFVNQSRLYQSELAAIRGWSAAHLAYARLCRARGLRLKDCR